MPATGPGDKPNRPRRRKPKPPSRAQVQQATQNARPLSARPVRPKPVPRPPSARTVQQRAQNARPLSSKPARPKQVVRPLAQRAPKRLTTAAPSKLDVHTDVRTAQRQSAVHVYDQLTRHQKRQRVAQARQKVKTGKADASDHAILHIHKSRVEGKRKRVALVKAFNALDPSTTPTKLAQQGMKETTREGTARLATAILKPSSVAGAIRAVGAASAYGLKAAHVPKIVQNVPKDFAETVVTTPSSLAKFASDAVHHPAKVPGELAAPYKELAKDPKKFVTEHPVTTALMLEPARVPGRALGKGARLAGKQTLERPAATLENTAIREARTGHRDVVARAVQARRDAKNPQPSVTSRELDRRVDESFAANQKHAERVRSRILHDAHEQAKTLPKAERPAHMEAAREQAKKAVVTRKRRRYAEEFGATPKVENGRVVTQPQATVGHLHDNFAEAQQVRDHLNAANQQISRGPGSVFEGGVGAKLNSREKLDVKYRVVDAGEGKYAVMPNQIGDRITHHSRVGTSRAVPAVVLRQTRRMLSKAVLPYHPTWLSGQAIEGTVRSAVQQAGPTSWMIAHRLQARHPDLYKAVAERAVPGGQLGRAVAGEMTHRTLAQEIPESQVARKFTEYGQKPGIKQARALNDALTKVIFERLNGKLLEGTPQKAMLGRALKQSPLMERHMIGLTNKAIDDAARGLKSTENQVAASREVERAFGKYAGFSPRMRGLIMHWTPFVPWWINSARFLLQTLPRDHPVASALVGDISTVEEDWRKQQGLSLRHRSQTSLPPWMLGGYPVQGGRNLVRLGHYLPGGSETDVVGGLSGLFLPQFAGTYGALKYGKDWKGDDLKHADGTPYNKGEQTLYAAAQLLESLTPGTAQAAQILHAPETLGGPSDTDTSSLKDRALKQIRPISTTPLKRPKRSSGTEIQVTPVQVRPIKVRPVKVDGG